LLLLVMAFSLSACSSLGLAQKSEEPVHRFKALSLPGFDDAPHFPTQVADHPRLILPESDLTKLKKLVETDPLAKQWYTTLRQRADALVRREVDPDVENPMLRQSRERMLHISTLALIYRISGEQKYAEQGINLLVASARMTTWKAEEFLATAEMTAAVGIGYDWLYDAMSPPQRDVVREGLVRNGLQAGLKSYGDEDGWTRVQHNWNLVCNGGMIVGALAVLGEEPRVAQDVLNHARRSIRDGLAAFAPDGGWEEGPSYWTYSTRYAALALSALQTGLGTDWSLSKAPGLGATGLFRMYASGPTDLAYNFGDSSPVVGNSAALAWFASEYKRPEYAAFEQKEIGRDVGAFDLVWYRGAVDEKEIARLPLDAEFKGVGVVSMRSAWNDTSALYIAAKGGSNQAHHGHLDQGSFVLDAVGERWAIDLGSDNYELKDYFGSKRGTYYRVMTRGHNTITIDNQNQDKRQSAEIVSFESEATSSRALIDMTRLYDDDATRVERGIEMIQRRQVLIQDEIDLKGKAEVRWNMHTNADVRISGKTATLRQNGKTMTAKILSPADATFDVTEIRLPPPQLPVRNTRKLYIRLPDARKHITITVLFTPGDEPSGGVRVVPLRDWEFSQARQRD
jgi:hypothetical protein